MQIKIFFDCLRNKVVRQLSNMYKFHESIKKNKHYENIKYYLECEKNNDILYIRNKENKTVFDIALEKNDLMMIKKLSSIKNFINHMDNNMTIFMNMIINNTYEQISEVLKNNFDVIDFSIVGKYGTILHMLVLFCKNDLLDLFVKYKQVTPVINVRDKNGFTVLDQAMINLNIHAVVVLLCCGGKVGNKIIYEYNYINRDYIKIVKIKEIMTNKTFKYMIDFLIKNI
jgi:hypothetical protein